jgi:hypothetical protein
MTERDYTSDAEANEMMDQIYEEAGTSMSPTITPFVSLGTNDPSEEIMDGPTTPEQAEARDLWETFSKT